MSLWPKPLQYPEGDASKRGIKVQGSRSEDVQKLGKKLTETGKGIQENLVRAPRVSATILFSFCSQYPHNDVLLHVCIWDKIIISARSGIISILFPGSSKVPGI